MKTIENFSTGDTVISSMGETRLKIISFMDLQKKARNKTILIRKARAKCLNLEINQEVEITTGNWTNAASKFRIYESC